MSPLVFYEGHFLFLDSSVDLRFILYNLLHKNWIFLFSISGPIDTRPGARVCSPMRPIDFFRVHACGFSAAWPCLFWCALRAKIVTAGDGSWHRQKLSLWVTNPGTARFRHLDCRKLSPHPFPCILHAKPISCLKYLISLKNKFICKNLASLAYGVQPYLDIAQTNKTWKAKTWKSTMSKKVKN